MVFPQIIHFLKISRSGWRQTVDMLTHADIDAIVVAYRDAALRSRACGFDGVELHMAHAYTLSSFLSRRNHRRDEYGGTLENRLRLPARVLREVRAAVGDDFPVGVRFVGDECIRGGYTPLDAGPIAAELVRAGADYISLSAGGKFEDARPIEGEPLYPYTGYSGDRCMPGAAYPDGANLYIPQAVREYLRNAGLDAPVVGAGKIGTRALAEKMLVENKSDLIGMARALLADPDLPKKWQADAEHRVVRCVYGNVCKSLDENFKRVDCTLWPRPKKAAASPSTIANRDAGSDVGSPAGVVRGQAPESDDTVPPAWPEGGAQLRAEFSKGRVLLRWEAAHDNEAVYGYEVFRIESWPRAVTRLSLMPPETVRSAPPPFLAHYTSVRAGSLRFEDSRVVSGARYEYAIRPYDLAGNRGPISDTVEVVVPPGAQIAAAAPEDPTRATACVGKMS
jgi:2,4-dienoyl-CoA reductase-like NADH-dependent reductase (Old Yellow Enzyme family)